MTENNSETQAPNTEFPDVDGVEFDQPGLHPEIARLQAENAELINDVRRAQADFVNYRNRTQQELSNASAVAAANFAKAMLPVLDNLDAMRAAGELTGPAASIANELDHVLGSKGVVRCGENGEAFNPELHEAVTVFESPDHESGTVFQVVRFGYRSGERLIRPAQVIVAQ